MEENKTLKNKVFEALGEATMCWSETPKGVFDSTKAKEIGDRLMEDIKQSHRDIITNTISSVGHQLFLQGIEMKKDYEILIGKETKPSLQEAVEVLCNAFKEDKDLFKAYKDNIAMSFKDEYNRVNKNHLATSDYEIHHIANKAAENFLNLLISK